MAITKDTLKYVANLARVGLTEEELEGFTGQLDRILDYVNKLKAVDVSRLQATSHVLEMKNVYREDKVKKSLPVSDVIKNAPAKKNDLFKVGKIIEA